MQGLGFLWLLGSRSRFRQELCRFAAVTRLGIQGLRGGFEGLRDSWCLQVAIVIVYIRVIVEVGGDVKGKR